MCQPQRRRASFELATHWDAPGISENQPTVYRARLTTRSNMFLGAGLYQGLDRQLKSLISIHVKDY